MWEIFGLFGTGGCFTSYWPGYLNSYRFSIFCNYCFGTEIRLEKRPFLSAELCELVTFFAKTS